MEYSKIIEIRWADLDPNFHVLHSKYYDFGAYVRMSYLTENGITAEVLNNYNIGPIIFREECVFRREIKFKDVVKITLHLGKARKDVSRWTMKHEIILNEHKVAAQITVDGAWMDTVNRKLATPPAAFIQSFDAIPKAHDFEWI
ncbi:MAG: thioesterase family protein [Sphingobacteriales bacterium]|nr:thioesterase family protein [Sphingobacteriales bacterium]